MNKQKGFTIIELIVVIAIIAVLAAIVMVNVTQYIGKSKDAAIKANLDTIRTNAAVYMSDQEKGNGDFGGFLATAEYTIPAAAVATQTGTITKNCNDTAGTCVDNTATKFCVSSTLASSATTIYCIDGDGSLIMHLGGLGIVAKNAKLLAQQ